MSLRRVGGKADGGVDLSGWWWLPSVTRHYVRELEGVAYRYTADDPEPLPLPKRCQPLVALLVSESPFTKATLLRAQSSSLPLFLLHIPGSPCQGEDEKEDEKEGEGDGLGAAFWNPALAGAQGLLGGEMELRWERGRGEGPSGGRPVLWHNGARAGRWVPPGPEPDLDAGTGGSGRWWCLDDRCIRGDVENLSRRLNELRNACGWRKNASFYL